MGARSTKEDLLTRLPDETLLALLEWLGPRDLLACSATNQRLRALALDDSLWRKACDYLSGRVAGPSTQGGEVVWWREYFEIKRSCFLQENSSVSVDSRKDYHLLADTLEELVLASDYRIALVPHPDAPPTRQKQVRYIEVAVGICDVVYSEGAILCLTAQNKLHIYDLASPALLQTMEGVAAVCCDSLHVGLWLNSPKGLLAVYDRSRGWDAAPKWTKVLGNKYSTPPSLSLDSSSQHLDGGVLVVYSKRWQVYGLADGAELGASFVLPSPTLPLRHPLLFGRGDGMFGGRSVSEFLRLKPYTTFFTPDHIVCCLPVAIRVIWKASLGEGKAPQFVDKVASTELFRHTQVVCRHSDALLVTLAGDEILCWPLPSQWQEELELLHERPLTHPQPEAVDSIRGLCCDSHRVMLAYTVPMEGDPSLRDCRTLAKSEVAVFSLGQWGLRSRLPLNGQTGRGGPAMAAAVVVGMRSLPHGRAALLTKSIMWGRTHLTTLQHNVRFLAPSGPAARGSTPS